jgi:serine/threonine protein kinase
MLSPNTILQNRYRVVRELGHGGMGAVYEAIDQRVSTVVALKETLLGKNSDARRAFEREAALLANLRHPGLPKVMDYFSEGEGEFLVMEFIGGHDLAELMELRGGPFPEGRVLKWADELLKLLEYLHSRQPPIVHRDIKPSNLKVTKDGDVFLLDFGLAKGAAGQMPTLMSEKSVLGYTPVYSPLEQIHGRGTDPRSDLYAFGATLYHLLTGQQPVAAPARYTAIEDEEPDPLRPPRELNSQISLSVSNVIVQAMSMSRRQRQSSAAEMRAALNQAAAQDRRTAEQQRLQEAETQRLEQERRTADEARKKAPEKPKQTPELTQRAAAGREVDEPRPAEPPRHKTIPAPYTPQPAPTADAHRIITDSTPVVQTVSPVDVSAKPKSNRAMIAFAIIIAVVAVSGIGIYFLASGDRGAQTNSAAQPLVVSNKPQPAAPTAPAGMVYVPGGEFTMGRDDGDDYERPAHKVSVKPFLIDQYEVNCGELINFLNQSGQRAGGIASSGCSENPDHKVAATEVTWDAAVRYCKWTSKRLPTEEEWEFAARGTDGRTYPWGNSWQQDAANAAGASSKPSDGGSYKHGASPFGAYDMAGNVWEWTASKLTAYSGGALPTQTTGDMRVIRGGAYDSDQNTATTTYRRGYPARGNYDYSKTGFRCAKDVQ